MIALLMVVLGILCVANWLFALHGRPFQLVALVLGAYIFLEWLLEGGFDVVQLAMELIVLCLTLFVFGARRRGRAERRSL